MEKNLWQGTAACPPSQCWVKSYLRVKNTATEKKVIPSVKFTKYVMIFLQRPPNVREMERLF
jgi:hypothetical protein